MQLKTIYAPIAQELLAVEQKLKTSLTDGNWELNRIGAHILRRPGKLIRPAVVLLAAGSVGVEKPRMADLAAAIELIHIATLTHDDVIDGAELRRGQPSIEAKFGQKRAILFGDYLYTKAFEIIAGLNKNKIGLLLLAAAATVCKGEMRQLRRMTSWREQRREYLRIISEKTAALFAVACESAAVLARVGGKRRQALKDYGRNLGISFQIVDDCLDNTLPLIYFKQSGSRSKAVAAALKIAAGYGARAVGAIKGLPEGSKKQSLTALVRYVLDQVKHAK